MQRFETVVEWRLVGREITDNRHLGNAMKVPAGEYRRTCLCRFTTKAEGSGIGLVLSRQIAEAHGGTLSLENRLAFRGCEARLRLPFCDEERHQPRLSADKRGSNPRGRGLGNVVRETDV